MRPLCWLGAKSPGGLALPNASPAPCQLYAPRGVFLNDDLLAVADTGNHRVLLWFGLPKEDGQPADVVLGQKDFYTEGPKSAGASIENGFNLPTAVAVYEGRLFVADAWHHRILVWNEVPTVSNTPPDFAIGQHDLSAVEPNRGGSPSREGLYCPYGIAWCNGFFYVCDTSNRRVVAWEGLPEQGQPPDYLIGQPAWTLGEENRGEGVGSRSFRWPHAITRVGEWTYIADAGNHRVLGWRGDLKHDRDADLVLGQTDFVSSFEFPYRSQGAAALRFPYSISSQPEGIVVADTANNRLLFWPTDAEGGTASPCAAMVAGQVNFDANGENRWLAVERETLCWPYGVCWNRNRIAIADSGNNRVMLWEAPEIGIASQQSAEIVCTTY